MDEFPISVESSSDLCFDNIAGREPRMQQSDRAFTCSTVPPTPTVTITGAVTISPARLQASVNDFSGLRGRYVINPMVTFSASAIPAETVKYIRFAFIVDADRVIKEGAIPVDGGDLRQGPVTQQYPLTFDVPVHFPNLRVEIRATFVDGSGGEMKMPPAEAFIQLPGVLP